MITACISLQCSYVCTIKINCRVSIHAVIIVCTTKVKAYYNDKLPCFNTCSNHCINYKDKLPCFNTYSNHCMNYKDKLPCFNTCSNFCTQYKMNCHVSIYSETEQFICKVHSMCTVCCDIRYIKSPCK